MKELRKRIEQWAKENQEQYYGLEKSEAQMVLWAFEDVIDKVEEMQKALEQAKTALKWATEYHTKTCTCVECEGLGVVIHTLHIVKGGESNDTL